VSVAPFNSVAIERRLPTPRADGDREAPRIPLGARRKLTTTKARTTNRLRALLLTGSYCMPIEYSPPVR
jgi:hypothetical protein